MDLLRSLLFVPGHKPRMIEKALGLPADALLLDLEDAVPESEKGQARATVAEVLAGLPADRRQRTFVRVSAVERESVQLDINDSLGPRLDGLCLPKVDDAEQVLALEGWLAEAERRRGLAPGHIRFIAIIESARGLLNAPGIAGCSLRLQALMFGGEDYARDLGLPGRGLAAGALAHARASVVVAAASARIAAIDGIWPYLEDGEGLSADAEAAKGFGFSGKAVIHPSQVEPVNRAFQPDAAEVAFAREMLAAYEEAERAGSGAFRFRGQMVDRPILERAHHVLQLDELLRKAT